MCGCGWYLGTDDGSEKVVGPMEVGCWRKPQGITCCNLPTAMHFFPFPCVQDQVIDGLFCAEGC